MRLRKRYKKPKENLPPSICAWCGKVIPEDTEVWSFGIKARPEIDLADQRGKVIDLTVVSANKIVPAIVVTEDSEAKKEKGYDMVFMLCSQYCALQLKEALDKDMQRYGRHQQ